VSHAEASASWSGQAGDRHRQPANFRDLGGLPLTGGGVTRAGVLYRSDALYPGDAAPAEAPLWPPALVIDLRSPGETAAGGYSWPAGVRVDQLPLLRRAAVVTGRHDSGPGPRRPVRLESLYLAMLQAVPEKLASLVGLAAQAAGPVLVHCAAGKDRTGVAVALLLMAAGVEPESVIADYTATTPRMPALLSRLQMLGRRLPADADAHPELLGTPVEAITAVAERLDGWPGGLPAWLASHGASPDDAARWRDRLAGVGR
jgi:rhodanese-related sulfurtransferase